jgi:outer membrane protein OmpA-like peptidoglycan-associated protein
MNVLLNPLGRNHLVAAAVAFALFAGCSAAPTKPDGAEAARAKLTALQSDSELATRAPLAIKDADLAVQAAEKPQADKALGAHLVLIADRKIDIAQAQSETHLAVDQRKGLAEEREAMRLQSRTLEADAANNRANVAQADANLAHSEADVAQRNTEEMQRQIAALQAKVTDRGLVLTLGDVLFTTGTATLNSGANKQLEKLAAFLNKYPERTTLIEGYTDSVGTDEFNQGLSQRRADAVKSYLTGQGIAANRLTATGRGENSPVGDNTSATGRQQNRRVEVLIENQLVSAR